MERSRTAKWILTAYFVLFTAVLYLPMILMAILSFQGQRGLPYFPMQGFSGTWWQSLFDSAVPGSHADEIRSASLTSLYLALAVGAVTAIFALTLSMAFRRRFRGDGALFYLIMLGLMTPGFLLSLGTALFWQLLRDTSTSGPTPRAPVDGARHELRLGDPVRLPCHGRGLEPLRQPDRGGSPGSRRQRATHLPRGDAAAHLDGAVRRVPLRVRALVERVRPHGARSQLGRADAADPDLCADRRLGHPSRPLRARHRHDVVHPPRRRDRARLRRDLSSGGACAQRCPRRAGRGAAGRGRGLSSCLRTPRPEGHGPSSLHGRAAAEARRSSL